MRDFSSLPFHLNLVRRPQEPFELILAKSYLLLWGDLCLELTFSSRIAIYVNRPWEKIQGQVDETFAGSLRSFQVILLQQMEGDILRWPSHLQY